MESVEQSILQMHKEGISDKQIAKDLSISLYQVKNTRKKHKLQNYHWRKYGKYQGSHSAVEYGRDEINVVKAHNKNETMRHYIVKCIIAKILIDSGHAIVTEVRTKRGIIDIYDIDEKLAYEPETAYSPARAREKAIQLSDEGIVSDVIVINLKEYKLDESVDDWTKRLKRRIRW